jgi:drug/metabolite transporter (DMT)-like permease
MIHHFILVMSIFMLSTAPVLVKFITLEPMVTLVWRLAFVSLMLLPFAYSYFKKLTKHEVLGVSLVSLVLAVHFWMWFSGIALLNVSVTAVIFASNPIFTAILGFFILREPFKKRYFVAIVLSILGIYLTFASQRPEEMSPLGAFYILGGSFLYSLYMVLSKRSRKHLPNGIFTFLLNSLAGLMGLIACIFMIITGHLEVSNITQISFFNIKVLFLLALLPSVLGHTLLIGALHRYNLNLISCLKLLSPLSASLMASYFFGDVFRPGLIFGFALVSTGVLFAIPWRRSKV